MFNKNSCINLGISSIQPYNMFHSEELRNEARLPVIEFRHFRLFAMTVYLNLFWIDLGKPTTIQVLVIPKISKCFITRNFLISTRAYGFEVFRSLNSKADHLVNWDLVSLIHGSMDANKFFSESPCVSHKIST